MNGLILNRKFVPSREKDIKKGEYLLRAGELCKHFFYVKKGCLRSYVVDSKGKEHIYQFAPEDWIISDEDSVIDGKPALLYIDAIEDSTVRIFTKPEGDWIDSLDKEVETELIGKFERKISSFRKRIIQLLSASAEERYRLFITAYPNMIQRIPLKMVASYLGITPETLSRVRKELIHKH